MFIVLAGQNLLNCMGYYIQKSCFALKWFDYAKAIA